MKKGKKDEGEILPDTWEPSGVIGPEKSSKDGKKVKVFVM